MCISQPVTVKHLQNYISFVTRIYKHHTHNIPTQIITLQNKTKRFREMLLIDNLPTSKYILNTQIHCGNFQEELHAPRYFQNMKFKLVHLLNTEIAKRNPQRHSLLFQAAIFPFSQRFIIREVLPSPGVALNTEAQLQRS